MNDEDYFKTDPIEDDPKYADIFARVDIEVNDLLKNHPHKGEMGFCFISWEMKKELLWKKYKIKWRTPAEMNPTILFD